MKVQVLASVMNDGIDEVIKSMKISSDAVIINQCDKNDYREKEIEGGRLIKFYSFNERGVGRSRNSAINHSSDSADIVLFADHDMTYVDGYEKLVTKEFKAHPEADMIVFNIESDNPDRPLYMISKWHRITWRNSLRHGAVKFAVRRDALLRVNVSFSLLFGGGAKYMSGEDSLFIYQCIKAGLKVFGSPVKIGSVRQDESTWFKGYTDKFFFDKGALFKALSPKYYRLLIMQFVIRKRKSMSDGRSILGMVKLMQEGADSYV